MDWDSFKAGIREYWLVDARGERQSFDILKTAAKRYDATPKSLRLAQVGRVRKIAIPIADRFLTAFPSRRTEERHAVGSVIGRQIPARRNSPTLQLCNFATLPLCNYFPRATTR